MMTPAEYPTAYRVAEELRQHSSIRRNFYNNIVLSTDYPGFTDVLDPDIRMATEALTLHWPGGSPDHQGNFETINWTGSENNASKFDIVDNTMAVRQAILDSSIGSAAINRVPEPIQRAWANFKSVSPVPILTALTRCEQLGLPLAVCETSRVIESEIVPVDSRMMHLWYPNYLSPKPVLAMLKKVLRKVIADEIL